VLPTAFFNLKYCFYDSPCEFLFFLSLDSRIFGTKILVMRFGVIAVFLTLSIYSCTKEEQVCVSCVGLDNQFGFDESTRTTECAEDSTTAFGNAFKESERLGGQEMNCTYTGQ